jgi:hypothetical protein
MRSAPKRRSNIRRTTGTKEEPPVRNTMFTAADRQACKQRAAGGSHLALQLKTFCLIFVLSVDQGQRSTKSAEDPFRCPPMAGLGCPPRMYPFCLRFQNPPILAPSGFTNMKNLTVGIRRPFENHSPAANEGTSECKNTRYEAQDGPKHLREPCKSSKMQLRKPKQPLVGEPVSGIEHEENRESFGKREIESGNSPDQDEEKTPEPERAVQVPIDPRKARAPVHLQTAAPILQARPPNDRTGQAQQGQAAAPDAVLSIGRSPPRGDWCEVSRATLWISIEATGPGTR